MGGRDALGRCIDCNRMVREGEGYSLNSANQIECDDCADKTDWHHHGTSTGSDAPARAKQSLEIEDAYKEGWWDAFKIENSGKGVGQTNEQVEQCEAFWTLSQAKKVSETDPRSLLDEMLEWLEVEISAIDTMYRGSPSYTRDAYWMKCEVAYVLKKAREAFGTPGI